MKPTSETAQQIQHLCVVLCAPSHPGNIGAAARAMKTMGLTDLRLVNPDTFPSEIATARASGATDVLDAAAVFGSLKEALADVHFVVGTSARHREFVSEVQPLRAAVESLAQASVHGKVALVFGTEMSGMTNEEVSHCHMLAYIPSNPAYSSLNLGSAVQVACYEWRMAIDTTPNYAAPEFALATQAQIDGFFAHMEKTLIALGFFNPALPKRLFPRLRRLFSRTRLEREEVDIFRGIFASVDAALTTSNASVATENKTQKP